MNRQQLNQLLLHTTSFGSFLLSVNILVYGLVKGVVGLFAIGIARPHAFNAAIAFRAGADSTGSTYRICYKKGGNLIENLLLTRLHM